MDSVRLCDLADRYSGEPTRRRFVVDGVLPVAGVSILYGPSGSGKTGAAVSIAMAVAQGDQWAGRAVDQGGVVYVAAEDRLGVYDRFHAANPDPGGHVPVVITGRPDRAMARSGGSGEIEALIEAELMGALGGALNLIVIDTLATVFGDASQDDSGAASAFMNQLAALAETYGCAVLVVHHTGKRGSEMRGSQVYYDRADAVLRLASKNGGATIALEKQRSTRSTGVFAFEIDGVEIDDCGETVSVQIVREVREINPVSASIDRVDDERPETDREVILRVLEEVTSDGDAVTVGDLKAACFEEWPEKSEAARRKAFYTNINALKSEGKIVQRGKKVTIKVTRVTGDKNGDLDPKSHQSPLTSPPYRGEGGDNGDTGGDRFVAELGKIVDRPGRSGRKGRTA